MASIEFVRKTHMAMIEVEPVGCTLDEIISMFQDQSRVMTWAPPGPRGPKFSIIENTDEGQVVRGTFVKFETDHHSIEDSMHEICEL